jgi:hypothetical protein
MYRRDKKTVAYSTVAAVRLACRGAGRFYACREVYSKAAPRPSLWFDEFDWSEIRERVESLLQECHGCVSWDDVIEQLAPHLRYVLD